MTDITHERSAASFDGHENVEDGGLLPLAGADGGTEGDRPDHVPPRSVGQSTGGLKRSEDASRRATRARLAAYTKWSRCDGVDGTEAARAAGPGRLAYWEQKVDPDLTLGPAERRRRAEAARRAHFTRLALVSARTRSRKNQRR